MQWQRFALERSKRDINKEKEEKDNTVEEKTRESLMTSKNF
jgi:hypothetical protein